RRDEETRLRRVREDAEAAERAAAEAAIPDYELPSPEDFEAEPPPPPPEPEPVPVPVPQFSSEVPASFDDVPTAEVAELKAIEELGTELDALSLADVAREIFPDLKKDYEPWQIAR